MLLKNAAMTPSFRLLLMSYAQYVFVFMYFFRSGDILDKHYHLIIDKLTVTCDNSTVDILRAESISFRLFDTFKINCQLILAIYSLSFSYVIVLVQFEYGI